MGYLLAPPWSSINNLWWWLFLMWGFMVGGQPILRVGGRHHGRATDIARGCMCSSQFFSFFENFSKCFWLFKGEKIIFFKKFSNNGLVSKKIEKIFITYWGGVKTQSDKYHFFFFFFFNPSLTHLLLFYEDAVVALLVVKINLLWLLKILSKGLIWF